MSPLIDPLLRILRVSQGLKQPPGGNIAAGGTGAPPTNVAGAPEAAPELGAGVAAQAPPIVPPTIPPAPAPPAPIEPCLQKTTIDPPSVESLRKHIETYIRVTLQRPEFTLNTDYDNILEIPLVTTPKSIDIVDPKETEPKIYDTFGETCVGSHALTIHVTPKAHRKSTLTQLGGASESKFVFLIAVPGFTPKKYERPDTKNLALRSKKNGTPKQKKRR